MQNWPESCLVRGEDDDLVPAAQLHSLGVDLKDRLGRLKNLDQQLPRGLAGLPRSLNFHLKLLGHQPSPGLDRVVVR